MEAILYVAVLLVATMASSAFALGASLLYLKSKHM